MRLLATAGAVAILAATFGTAATALTLTQAASPAEKPPAGYSKDVYVDSRGCVYVRANIGSTVNWVPRLTSDRKTVVCGMAPSGAGTRRAAAPPPPPAPTPPTAIAPAATAAVAGSAPRAAAPARPEAPVRTVAAPTPSGPAAISRTMDVNCPADGSSARVQIGGDTVKVRCPAGMTRATSYVVTHADGSRSRLVAHPAATRTATATAIVASVPARTVTGSRVIIGGAAPGTPNNTYGSGYGITASAAPVDPVPQPVYRRATAKPVQVPAGYRAAWDDDRLNPYRGPRSAYGDAQMATVYDTTKVPMVPAETTTVRTVIVSKTPAGASTAPVVASGARYVQVGAFGQAGNAQNAVAKIRGLGFGSATSRTGSGLTLVMAGPFSSAAELQRALQTLRGHYPDAYPRG